MSVRNPRDANAMLSGNPDPLSMVAVRHAACKPGAARHASYFVRNFQVPYV